MTFPIEIWEQIFLYIDPVTLTKLRTICKFWKEIIDKILKEYGLWYKKCEEDIPQNIWSLLLESLYPSKFYTDFENAKEEVEIWINMYKWWSKSKRLPQCDTSVECLDPVPKHRSREDITCTAALGKILAIGTSEGYIYFYDIDALSEKPIYVADHMEFVCKVKFVGSDGKIIVVSSSINGHIKFWDFKSKELISKDRGKLLCTSHSYCYTVVKNTLIVQGCIPKTLYELPVDDIIAGTADGNKVSLYTEEGHFLNIQLAEDGEVFFTEYVEPPELFIRHYYMFKTNIAVCITEHGYLGFSIQGEKWKFHNILPTLHGIPTAVLIYAHLLVLGLDSGHVCIYYVEDFNILDLNSLSTKRVILDTEPIISLDISAYYEEYVIAASSKRVHFIRFI